MPMCGVPHHAARHYLGKLVERGFKVAIAEQVEDPKLAKGIVKREVVRVVTPGTITDDEQLEPKAAHYLVALLAEGGAVGLAHLDVTTGEFAATQLALDGPRRRAGAPRAARDLVRRARRAPSETHAARRASRRRGPRCRRRGCTTRARAEAELVAATGRELPRDDDGARRARPAWRCARRSPSSSTPPRRSRRARCR